MGHSRPVSVCYIVHVPVYYTCRVLGELILDLGGIDGQSSTAATSPAARATRVQLSGSHDVAEKTISSIDKRTQTYTPPKGGH